MIRYTKLLEKDYRLYIGKSRADIYKVLAIDAKTKVFSDSVSFFVFLAAYGYHHNLRQRLVERHSAPMRVQIIRDDMLSTLYTIMINHLTLDQAVEEMSEKDFFSKGLKICEEYAEGAIDHITSNLLKDYMDGEHLLENEQFGEMFFDHMSKDLLGLDRTSSVQHVQRVRVRLSDPTIKRIKTISVSLVLIQEQAISDHILASKKTVYFTDMINRKYLSNQVSLDASGTDRASMEHRIKLTIDHKQTEQIDELRLIVMDSYTKIIEVDEVFKLRLIFDDTLI